MSGKTDPGTRAVGAHQAHLSHFSSLTAGVTCMKCHDLPSDFEAPGHSNEDWNYIGEKIEGNSASPVWTDPATAACGTCHGIPPTGHDVYDITDCWGCHEAVIDNVGNIMDKSKHVNGQVNVFGSEYPMF